MVSFTCNRCQDVVKKPKVLGHSNTCGTSSFTCVDCMELFDLNSVKHHTSCITEVDKYQGQWKQKCSVNGNPKRLQMQGIDIDSDVETAKQRLHPPRPRMDALSDSDSDDSDWVHMKKSNGLSSTTKQVKQKILDEDTQTGTELPPKSTKRSREENSSATFSDRRKDAGRGDDLPTAAQARAERYHDGEKSNPTHINGKSQREETLQLPRPCSTSSTDCVVPTFVLGSASEVAGIVADILEEHPERASMRPRDLSKELVHRYTARIAKSVRCALDTAIKLGKIGVDGEGNICHSCRD